MIRTHDSSRFRHAPAYDFAAFRRLGWVVVLAVGCGLTATNTVHAATVLLESGESIRGTIVSQTLAQVIVDAVDANGKVDRRTIPAEQIAHIRRPVDQDRLKTLDPSDPNKYRLYAEELAEKAADPEARSMALRLYVIAAFLSPEDLGRSCLLGMAGIADSPAEARRFRSMAFLLDRGHDRRLLGGNVNPATAAMSKSAENKKMLDVLRLLRTGRRRDAEKLFEREPEMLRAIERILPHEHSRAVISRVCVHCTSGTVVCSGCKGVGKLANGKPCLQCRVGRISRGKIRCPLCEGKYNTPQLTQPQLTALVKAELQLLGGASMGLEAKAIGWRPEFAEAAAARPLDLRSITPFDPALCVFQNNRWTAP